MELQFLPLVLKKVSLTASMSLVCQQVFYTMEWKNGSFHKGPWGI